MVDWTPCRPNSCWIVLNTLLHTIISLFLGNTTYRLRVWLWGPDLPPATRISSWVTGVTFAYGTTTRLGQTWSSSLGILMTFSLFGTGQIKGNSDGDIFSKTHFKPSGGNSYLHAWCYHHPRWIKNVPYGHFCRLRRTCTRKEDYLDQSELLRKKFQEKGYDVTLVETAFNKYLAPLWQPIKV